MAQGRREVLVMLTHNDLVAVASKITAYTLTARHESPEPSPETVSKATAVILGIDSADEPITKQQAAVFALAAEMLTRYELLMKDYPEIA
jgi:hypothetical protein